MENKKFKKLPLSVAMVIYNEEALLERALLSCVDIADEIIIIHDGECTDKSLEIAKKYTNKIFERHHIGQAEQHRVFSYEQAKNDWIFQLDADEYLSDELRENLEKLISGDADAYSVSWSTFYKNTHYLWHRKRILFRKSKIYFIGACHEYVKPIDKKVSIKKTNFALFHEPAYDNSTFATFRTKWKKWSKIHAGQLLEDFASIPKWNCPLDDWEQHRRIRMRHPILLGMIATPAYHAFHCAKNFLKQWDPHILKMGIFAVLYHIHLYYYLNKYKKDEKI